RLADGPVEANELFDDAEAFGFSRRTVRRALVDLGLKPTKQGNDGPWCWTAERNRQQAGNEARSCGVAEGQGDKETRGQGEVKADEGSGLRVQGSEKDAGADDEPSGLREVAGGQGDEADGQCKMQIAKCKTQNDASGSGSDSEDVNPIAQDLRPEALAPNLKSEDGQLKTDKQSAAADDADDDPEFDPIIPEEGKVADNDEGQVVIVVLRPAAPGAECLVEDGQLGAETQTSGP
ncbi:MAG TPA: hypothetical protein VFI31_20700, partial [Pirellulales bacterium]|nr:hypothetical protein [Pirellulales bacterium]